MGSGGGKKISVPPPSAPAPTPSDAGQDMIKAADEERKRLKRAFGQSQTILTGAGLGIANTDKKQMLSGVI